MTATSRPVPPTGEQYEIARGDARAHVTEVGATLRAYSVGGRAVLDGFAAGEQVTGARGQVLVPWPNRIQDGRYRFDGEDQQLTLTEPEQHNAIHGLARWQSWRVVERADDRIALTSRVHARTGWPFVLDVLVDYRLGPDGLTVRTVGTNVGDRPLPYGHGTHPYLTVGTDHVDDAELLVPAQRRILTGEQQIPTGSEDVAGTDFDFRRPRRIGDQRIDFAFTELHRDPDGRARVRLSAPGGPSVALWVDERYPYVEIFTGDTLPAAKRRTGLGVEPMTCPPNAFATGTDVIRLEPGASYETTWGIEPGD